MVAAAAAAVVLAAVAPSHHLADDVHGDREHDGGVLLRGDVVQRLQVAELPSEGGGGIKKNQNVSKYGKLCLPYSKIKKRINLKKKLGT